MGILRESLQYETLHETGGADTSAAGSEETDERCSIESAAHHEHHHQKTHTECRSEVG